MHRLIGLWMIALLALMAPLSAAYANEIAVVNIQKIMRDSKAANTVREQVKKKQKSFQAELNKEEKALQKEDQELAKQRNVLSQEAFKKKYGEFRKKAVEAQKQVRVKRGKLDKGLAKALADIQKRVTSIVESICKEKGYDMAISGSQALYASSRYDITDEVLSRLNKELPNINVSFN